MLSLLILTKTGIVITILQISNEKNQKNLVTGSGEKKYHSQVLTQIYLNAKPLFLLLNCMEALF